jgi:hypothetical protein
MMMAMVGLVWPSLVELRHLFTGLAMFFTCANTVLNRHKPNTQQSGDGDELLVGGHLDLGEHSGLPQQTNL